METKAQAQHRWLQQLIGEWTYESEAMGAPGDAPYKASGTERVRALGDLWVQCEGEGDMPGGGRALTCMTLGFDSQRQRYVGTWIGSMMSHLWVYEGEMDAAGKVLTLSAEGPDFEVQGKYKSYRDVIHIVSPDHRMLTGHMQAEDGNWVQFMTTHYRRMDAASR